MPLLDATLAALREPVGLLFDPRERIYWPLLLSGLGMALLLLGPRAGARALWDGLLSPDRWARPSSRADLLMLFARAAISALLRIPWATATTAAALAVGLALHARLGPPPELALQGPAFVLLYTLALFVVWDASRFGLHWLMHRVPILWKLHQVHHSAEVLTPLTLYRVHPLESVLYDLRGLLVTAGLTGLAAYLTHGTAQQLQLLGVNFLALCFNAAGGNLRHSHVWLGFGPLERVFMSPAQHQLHHGRDPGHQRTNYGTWLAIWDHLAGTWVSSVGREAVPVGLDDANHRGDALLSMLVDPLRDILTDLPRTRRRAWLVPALLLGTAMALGCGIRRAKAAPPAAEDVEREEEGDPAEVDFELEPAPTLDDDAAPPRDDGAVDFELDDDPSFEDPPTADAEGDLPRQAPAPDAPPPEALEDFDVMTDEVSILGAPDQRSRIGGSAHRIGAEELERKEADDIHRLLREVPGVYIREEDGFGLRPNIGMRGATSDRSAKVNLMEDGVLLTPAPYSAPAAYYFPMMTRMVGVEVFKGPAALRYGPNTIGGAMNLQTRAIPRDMRGGMDIGAGMRGYGKAHGWWGTSTRRFGVLGEAVHVRSTGFKELDGGGDTGFGKTEMMLKGRYHSDPGRTWYHQLDLRGGASIERSNETYLGLTDADFERTPYRRYAASQRDVMNWWRTQARVDYLVAKGSDFESRTTLYRHDFYRDWQRLNRFRGADFSSVLANPDVGQTAAYYAVLTGQEDSLTADQVLLQASNGRRYVSQGIANVMHWRPGQGRLIEQDIELGARLHFDQIERDHYDEAFEMRSGVLVPEGTPRVDTTDNRGRALAGSLHLVDELTVRRLTVSPGVRVELIKTWFDDTLADTSSSNFNAVVLPGVGSYVQATPWLGVLGGVHTGFSPVAPGQPEGVLPEQSLNYELGLRSDLQRRWLVSRIEAVGFFNNYKNLSSQCTVSAGCDDTQINRQFNAGRVHVYGVEAMARERFLFPRSYYVELDLGYTYTASRFLTSFASGTPVLGDVRRGDALPYVPEHTGSGGVVFGHHMFSVDLSGAVIGEMRDVPGRGSIPDEVKIPTQVVFDFGARVHVTRRATIYTSLDNMFNRVNMVARRPYGARPGMPAQFMVGLKYDFGGGGRAG